MRRQLAAATSVVLHAVLIVGAALIVFPLSLEKPRAEGLEIELLEVPGQDTAKPEAQAEAAAAPETEASSPPVTQTVRAVDTLPPSQLAEQSQSEPVPSPPTSIKDPVQEVPLTPAEAAPRTSAVVEVNPPVLSPNLTQAPQVAVLPHELPSDPVVPPLNPAPVTGHPVITPVNSNPQPIQSTQSGAGPADGPTRPAARFDRAALGAQLHQIAPGTPTRGFDRTALGTAVQGARPRGAGRLSMRQKVDLISMIRRQITPCWNPPSMTENSGVVTVTLRIQLEPTGQVSSAPSVSAVTGAAANNQAYVTAMIGSVRRAVLRCAPLKLPSDLYDAWSDVELNFDPRDLL